jgi:hypothetical protein
MRTSDKLLAFIGSYPELTAADSIQCLRKLAQNRRKVLKVRRILPMSGTLRIRGNCFGLSYLPLFQCEPSATEDMRDIRRMATQMPGFQNRLER